MSSIINRISKRSLITNPGTWDPQDIRDILDAHNNFRRITAKGESTDYNGDKHPYATNMNSLFWDPALEQVASIHASRCHIEHNDNRALELGQLESTARFEFPSPSPTSVPVGENIYYSSVDPTTFLGNFGVYDSVSGWYEEDIEWVYGTYGNSGTAQCYGVCGHYTQGVWAKTRYIGCGYYNCQTPTWDDGDKSWVRTFVVCNYYPSGNRNGDDVYLSSSSSNDICTQCDADRLVCQDGLCTGGMDSSFVIDSGTSIDLCDDGTGRDVCSLTNTPTTQPTAPTTAIPTQIPTELPSNVPTTSTPTDNPTPQPTYAPIDPGTPTRAPLDPTTNTPTTSAPTQIKPPTTCSGDLTSNNIFGIHVDINIDWENDKVLIYIICPLGYWCGIGFDATMMSDLPYAIIISSDSTFNELRLGNYEQGTLIGIPSFNPWDITTDTVNTYFNATRSVQKGFDANGYEFDYNKIISDGYIQFIWARSNFDDQTFGNQHQYQGNTIINCTNTFTPTLSPTIFTPQPTITSEPTTSNPTIIISDSTLTNTDTESTDSGGPSGDTKGESDGFDSILDISSYELVDWILAGAIILILLCFIIICMYCIIKRIKNNPDKESHMNQSTSINDHELVGINTPKKLYVTRPKVAESFAAAHELPKTDTFMFDTVIKNVGHIKQMSQLDMLKTINNQSNIAPSVSPIPKPNPNPANDFNDDEMDALVNTFGADKSKNDGYIEVDVQYEEPDTYQKPIQQQPQDYDDYDYDYEDYEDDEPEPQPQPQPLIQPKPKPVIPIPKPVIKPKPIAPPVKPVGPPMPPPVPQNILNTYLSAAAAQDVDPQEYEDDFDEYDEPVSVPDPQPVVQQPPPKPQPEPQIEFLSIEEAKKLKGKNREKYLNDDDFVSVFEMTKEEFSQLKGWKQTNLRKKKGFF